eukprot:6361253-Prymnesium_polylepis.2
MHGLHSHAPAVCILASAPRSKPLPFPYILSLVLAGVKCTAGLVMCTSSCACVARSNFDESLSTLLTAQLSTQQSLEAQQSKKTQRGRRGRASGHDRQGKHATATAGEAPCGGSEAQSAAEQVREDHHHLVSQVGLDALVEPEIPRGKEGISAGQPARQRDLGGSARPDIARRRRRRT